MSDFKVIVTIFVIASVQFYLCQAEQNIENTRSNRTARGSASSWIFVDTDEDNDSRDIILWLATQITNDIRRGRFRTHEGIEFTRPPPPRPAPMRPSPSRPPQFRPYPPRPTQPTPAPPEPGSLVKDPNPCNRELPAKPNFYLPGRRISEAKCDDFQWALKRKDEELKKKDACLKYRLEQGEQLFGPTVVGGRKTEPGEFPHMGALGWRGVDGDWKFQCGATLISEKFLLTAAHCSSISRSDTTVANTKPEIVRLGVTNIIKWPEDRNPYDGEIAQITVHPQYASPKKYYDIAVVEMKYELTFIDEYIRPACLWTRYDTSPLGNRAFATGWGFVDAAGTQKAADLQAADVSIIDSVRCDALLKPSWNRHFFGLHSHQICAGVLSGGVDTCQGDSGGPLQVKIPSSKRLSYVIGVTSFGRGCARKNSPGVYTRVSSFIDWIENIVWPK